MNDQTKTAAKQVLKQTAEGGSGKEGQSRLNSILYRVVCGVVMGIGGVLPGVSGGILAISLGIYEKMMLAIGSLFRSFRENFRYLLPLGIGGVIGILLTSNVLSLLIARYEMQLLSLFTGLVLGSLPGLYVEVRLDGPKLKPKHFIAALLGLGFVLLFALGESSVVGNAEVTQLTIPGALIAGAVLSVGTIIPGISSSFILVYLGLYPAVIAAIASVMDFKTLASSGIAAALASLGAHLLPLTAMVAAFGLVAILIIKLVNRMLRRHHATSYAAVIGFVVGSVALVLPNILAQFSWACPLFFLGGLGLSLLEQRIKKRITTAINTSDPQPILNEISKEKAAQIVQNEQAAKTDEP
jgi:putative membrane protein